MVLVKIGNKIPDANFIIMGDSGPVEISSREIFETKKVILFGLPGAFTPTCHLNHLPGYLEQFDTLKSKGIDDVVVVSVNDVWTMNAWAVQTKGKGKLRYLADGSATFTKKIGMDIDLDLKGMGIRSKRYSMYVENCVIRSLNVEDVPGEAVKSGVSVMLSQLNELG